MTLGKVEQVEHMSQNPIDPAAAARNQRMRQQAEHRVIVQATMQAKRSGKLPDRGPSSTGSEILTALVVVVVVVVMLVLAIRYGN